MRDLLNITPFLIRRPLWVLAFSLLVLHGCTMYERGVATASEPAHHYTLTLRNGVESPANPFVFRRWISYSLAPTYTFVGSAGQPAISSKVRPTSTPWASAWDRRGVARQMDRILRENGIESVNVRVRMIAHAVVASGWKQHVWNYNAWGVKQGSWDGDWYVMPTQEEDGAGNVVFVEDATWRSFDSWAEAIEDFQNRISEESDRPSYRAAWEHLNEERVSMKAARNYWESLGSGNYYTATKFDGLKFAQLCASVRSFLN